MAVTQQAQSIDDLASMCGLDINCEAGGIAEGRAGISGIGSVDAFFAAVINFQTKANVTASGIQAELDGIRGDFGIEAGADIGAQINAQADLYTEAGVEIVTEPARCEIDAQASVQASARCEGEVNPGSAMVECHGGCEVEASADVSCSAEADLKCTFTGPSIECNADCKGTCTLEGSAAAECSGTCNGQCNGQCSLMNAMGECQGQCNGTCMGSCDVEMNASATCMGKCSGECTKTNPSGGCEGAAHAECDAHANAMVMCEGRCDGEVVPPSAKAECQASAKAEASFNAECKPPSIDIRYQLAVGGNVDLEAQARFEAAVKNLQVRLPKLLASLKGADIMIDAAADLGATGKSAVMGAITSLQADADVKTTVGLRCALGELDAVAGAIEGGTSKLQASVEASAELTGALGLN